MQRDYQVKAAFFDVDETLLRIDTGTSWIKYLRRRGEISMLDLMRAAYQGFLYRQALKSIDAIVDPAVSKLQDESEQDMIHKSQNWYRQCVEPEVSSDALEAIESHRQKGEEVVLLTGTTQFVAEALSKRLDIEHTLCSRLEVIDGKYTGRMERRCWGEHKVVVAEEFADRHGVNLDESFFYSDSFLDLPMLNRIGTPVAVNPDWRLKRHAKKEGWQIVLWR